MINKNKIRFFLQKEIKCSMKNLYQAHLFGSITRTMRPNDVDVVFITKSWKIRNSFKNLRKAISNLCNQFFSIFRVKLSPMVLLVGEWRQVKRKFLSEKMVKLW